MPLDRHQQVARVWNWLPAFRAAAEYESLQRAALALSISPSALSRSVKLLEEALDTELFHRSAAGLRLTQAGAALLASTRQAMRLVHDAFADEPAHQLTLGTVGPVLSAIGRDAALDSVAERGLRLLTVEPGEVVERLFRGEIDLALTHAAPPRDAVPGRGLLVDELPELELVLAGEREARTASLEASDFSVPGAAFVVSSVADLLVLAERVAVSMAVPRCLVPPGVAIVEPLGRRLPVFAVRRQQASSANDVRFVRLLEAVRTRLDSGNVGVDEVV